MKKKPTEAEDLLWKYLKNKSTRHKIRRQHVIYNFVADFVCLRQKTVIEVDGKIHDKQKERDILRTDILNRLGFHVIRFTNEEVIDDPKSVVGKIKIYLDDKLTSFFPPSEATYDPPNRNRHHGRCPSPC